MAKKKKYKLEDIDTDAVLKELQSESERGGVLVASSVLDELLSILLKEFMVDDTSTADFVDGANAPLGTFSSRIRGAFCLGLLSRDVYDDLNIVRGIRNEFAHSFESYSFSDASIRDRCNKLKTAKLLTEANYFEELDAYGRFSISIATISPVLAQRALSARGEKRQIPQDENLAFHASSQPNEAGQTE